LHPKPSSYSVEMSCLLSQTFKHTRCPFQISNSGHKAYQTWLGIKTRNPQITKNLNQGKIRQIPIEDLA